MNWQIVSQEHTNGQMYVRTLYRVVQSSMTRYITLSTVNSTPHHIEINYTTLCYTICYTNPLTTHQHTPHHTTLHCTIPHNTTQHNTTPHHTNPHLICASVSVGALYAIKESLILRVNKDGSNAIKSKYWSYTLETQDTELLSCRSRANCSSNGLSTRVTKWI